MILLTNKAHIEFQIDDDDAEIICRYSWHTNNEDYLVTEIPYGVKVRKPTHRRYKPFVLHNLLLGKAPEGKTWDHENRDKLDNRRQNIRAVSHTIQQRNKNLRADNRSGIIGVQRNGNSWQATIDGESVGTFPTIEQAAEARKHAERKYWGTP